MKKLAIITFFLLVYVSFATAQEVKWGYSPDPDTIYVADMDGDSTILFIPFRCPFGCSVDLYYDSFGSTNDSIYVGKSIDGVNWQVFLSESNPTIYSTNTGGSYYYDASGTAAKGQMIDINNQTFNYLVVYLDLGTATNDTLIIRKSK